jgi:vacuolar-type H+-ATPase subunit E/Vma4
MTVLSSDLGASLAAAQDALHCAALRDAAAALGTAGDHAMALEADARVRADQSRGRARDAGTADALAALEIERSRVRRRGRGAVLRARMEAYQALRAQTRAAVGALRDTSDYPRLRATLVAALTRRLGPAAEISEAEGGGVRARSGDRQIDVSLTALADLAADAVAAGLEPPRAPGPQP